MAGNLMGLAPHLSGTERESQRVTLVAGQVLLNEGDDSSLVWVVDSGEVGIFRRLHPRATPAGA
jgi:CRP-like cAMP-binding protein